MEKQSQYNRIICSISVLVVNIHLQPFFRYKICENVIIKQILLPAFSKINIFLHKEQ